MFGFIKKIVLGQKKIYLLMTFVLSLLAAFEFMLLSMYTLSGSMERAAGQNVVMITGMTVLLVFLLALYINNFFIENKTDEFSLVLLSGRNTKQILKYITIQFGILFIVTAILGVGIGYGILGGLNTILQNYDNYALVSIQYGEAIGFFVAFVILNLCYVLLLNYSKFVRIKMNIAGYMNHVKDNEKKITFFGQFHMGGEKRKVPIGQLVAIVIAVIMLVYCVTGILNTDTDASNLIGYYIITLLSEIVILNFALPMLYAYLHDQYLLKKPVALHALNQLMNVSKVMVSVIYINAIAVPLIFTRFLDTSLNIDIKTIIICVYFILIGMILLCFIIRFFTYLPSRITDISVLHAIGYNKKQIYKIQNREIFGFIVFIVGLPLLVYGAILQRVYALHLLTLDMVMILAGSYIILYVIISAFMVISYKKLAKEVFNNVKYINRSE